MPSLVRLTNAHFLLLPSYQPCQTHQHPFHTTAQSLALSITNTPFQNHQHPFHTIAQLPALSESPTPLSYYCPVTSPVRITNTPFSESPTPLSNYCPVTSPVRITNIPLPPKMGSGLLCEVVHNLLAYQCCVTKTSQSDINLGTSGSCAASLRCSSFLPVQFTSRQHQHLSGRPTPATSESAVPIPCSHCHPVSSPVSFCTNTPHPLISARPHNKQYTPSALNKNYN